jgi:transcriptional regulator
MLVESEMYQPPHFREGRLDVQHALIRAHPFGALVSVGPDGLIANHFPFVVDAATGPLGTLRAHMSRGNAQWKSLGGAGEVLAIFQGPEGYITPSWYESKRETGKAVPTWNYVLVHVYGRPRVVEDRDWLARHVAELTDLHEGGREEPWAVSDAPVDFLDGMLKGIVGVEIEITRIEGKWKLSQNRTVADRAGVVEGLNAEGDERSLTMAGLVGSAGAPETR